MRNAGGNHPLHAGRHHTGAQRRACLYPADPHRRANDAGRRGLQEGAGTSPPASGTYVLGALRPGLSTFHIGNSLTGTTGSFANYAQTAGYRHSYRTFLRGGILTYKLWEIQAMTGQVLSNQSLPPNTGVNHFTVQPRDFDLAEAKHDILFFDAVRAKFPRMQPWFYAEWVEQGRHRPSDEGKVPGSQMKQVYPALTWEESMGAMLLYVEELQRKVLETYKEGKRPRILPSAVPMGWIKNWINHGKMPGLAPGSFYPVLFADSVHPGANGAYLVDLTWFAAFYRQSPEGKVLPVNTTLTAAQAAAMQRLAWDVMKNYPDCGLYEEGTTPVGKPEFSPAPARSAKSPRLRSPQPRPALVPLHLGRDAANAHQRVSLLRSGQCPAGDDAEGNRFPERYGRQLGG